MKFSGLAVLASQPRTVTPLDLARVAVASLQTSLFQRLRKAHGGPLAGRLSWLLVRAGQGDHDDHMGALSELAEFPPETIRTFIDAASRARDSLPSPHASRLAGAVVEALAAGLAMRRVGAELRAPGGVLHRAEAEGE